VEEAEMNSRLKRGIGGFAIGWSLVTVVNILTHQKEPGWMLYADGFFLVIAAYFVIRLIVESKPPSQ
jgi:hypothetical protein